VPSYVPTYVKSKDDPLTIAVGEYQSMLFTLLSLSNSSSTSGHCFHLSARLTEGTTMPLPTHALAHRDSFASALEREIQVCYHPNVSLFIGNPGSRSFQDIRVIAAIRPSPCHSTSRIEVSSSHFEYNKPVRHYCYETLGRSHPDFSFPSHFSSSSSSPPSMSFNRIHNDNAVASQCSLSP
jgi:hypothetical protein